MTKIYAIIKETGDYSDRTGDYSDRTWDIIQAVISEDKAKEIVQRLSDEARTTGMINSAKSEFRNKVIKMPEFVWNAPIFVPPIGKPIFNHDLQKDKDYVKEYTKEKQEYARVYNEKYNFWMKNIYYVALKAYYARVNSYVDEHFDLSTIPSEKFWVDEQYHYEVVELDE